MSQVTTIGLDIAKSVFHAHGADESGAMVFSRNLTRAKLLAFFTDQRPARRRLRLAEVRIIGGASCN